jgi:anhydro-N-acetylmuramic acid kinase
LHPLTQLFELREKYVVGLMSGTSIDGIDAALIRIQGNGFSTVWELVAFDIYTYPVRLQKELLTLATTAHWDADHLCRLNVVVAEYFARAVKQISQKAGIPWEQIHLIGSHGQTIRHLPESVPLHGFPVAATLQIGEPAVIAKRCGVVTVGDFRPADLALGGNGAPLVPFCDFLLLRSPDWNRGVLNIGGIANLTVLKKNCTGDEVVAFDTGPGNMILDGLTQKLFLRPFDLDGALARQGHVVPRLLEKWQQHPYFEKSPPKSTGREAFGERFLAEMLTATAEQYAALDLLATATELVARTIAHAYQQFILPTCHFHELIVSGGGVRNPVLMQALTQNFRPTLIKSSAEFGIPADAKEAICFAILANETVSGNSNNLPSATGAVRKTILGKICL